MSTQEFSGDAGLGENRNNTAKNNSGFLTIQERDGWKYNSASAFVCAFSLCPALHIRRRLSNLLRFFAEGYRQSFAMLRHGATKNAFFPL